MSVREVHYKDLCKTHARLFRYAAKNSYDMEHFAKVFMNSKVVNLDMDDIEYGYYSPYQVSFPIDLVNVLEDEEKEKGLSFPVCSQIKENEDKAAWIGEMYRKVQEATGVLSKNIYEVLPYKRMKDLWIGGHTVADAIIVDDLKSIVENHMKEADKERDEWFSIFKKMEIARQATETTMLKHSEMS